MRTQESTKSIILSIVLIILPLFTANAVDNYFFYIQFSNKNNSPYSLSNPAEFLSTKAISRRTSFGISCDSTDLPVNPAYVTQIANLGVKVHSRSKWTNGITVLVPDSTIMTSIRQLSFVKFAHYTGIRSIQNPSSVKSKIKTNTENIIYGSSESQINQINVNFLHNLDFTGRGITIGVLDAGFYNVNTNTAFDSLRLQNRLLGTKNIADSENVYNLDAHGANVLSIMTANLPSNYVGIAPHASYWLIRTEYAPTEYLVETDFWVSGIEFADSVGVDVVNSSLGYTIYDDTRMNYTYADMNGKTSRASIAANLASKKGIIVCNSAGNDASKPWKYIGAPSDAEGILCVGAVNTSGAYASFSSIGFEPSSPYYTITKPEVCATGWGTALVNTNGIVSWGNGTSYSSPLIAGAMACLLQYAKANYPSFSISKLIQSVVKSSTIYSNPTQEMGHGIPNFQQATSFLATNVNVNDFTSKVDLYYDNIAKTLKLVLKKPVTNELSYINIYSISGKKVLSKKTRNNIVEFPTFNLEPGVYFTTILNNDFNESKKFIIHNR